MDGSADALRQKLDQLLLQAAELSVVLDQADGSIVGVPHYSVIEARAHELGQRLSRQIQQQQMGRIAAEAADWAKCPECSARCQLDRQERTVRSVDGALHGDEPVAHCPNCRRGFFPPAGGVGL